jgi:hypothetical protein
MLILIQTIQFKDYGYKKYRFFCVPIEYFNILVVKFSSYILYVVVYDQQATAFHNVGEVDEAEVSFSVESLASSC